jgi:purine-nucleoside phosphorylase
MKSGVIFFVTNIDGQNLYLPLLQTWLMSDASKKFNETLSFLKTAYPHTPDAGIILGSGLGNFSDEVVVEKEISYNEIPNFPVSTVEGHKGKLIFGNLSGKKVVCMAGRFHYYEGYDAEQIVFPVRIMKLLGIKALLLSNAAGGVNPNFKVGDLMIITDHVSFFTRNPLIGKNISEFGPRFPDMSEPYKKELIQKARDIGKRLGIQLREGIYYGVTGPTFETRAEYRLVHALGGDAVGMSTVQECIVANHMGLPVFAMSVITDIGIRDDENKITHEEVLEAAKAAEPQFAAVFREMVMAI